MESHVYYITQGLPPAITTDRIRETMKDDPILCKVRALLIQDRNPETFSKELKTELKPYLNVWEQLSVGNDLVLRGERLVIPASLVKEAIELSHTGHQGASKSKQYLRASIWFPSMDHSIEQRIKHCIACQAATPKSTANPLQMSELPADG